MSGVNAMQHRDGTDLSIAADPMFTIHRADFERAGLSIEEVEAAANILRDCVWFQGMPAGIAQPLAANMLVAAAFARGRLKSVP